MRRAVAVVVAAFGCLLAVPAAPAWAEEPALTASTPQAGARLEVAPRQVALTFSSAPAAEQTDVTITGPIGSNATGGEPRVEGTSVTVPFAPKGAGEYTVAWQAASAEGEQASGTVTFTVSTSRTADDSARSAGRAAAAPGSGSGGGGGREVTITPLSQLATTPWWIWAAAAAAALVAMSAVAFGSASRPRGEHRA